MTAKRENRERLFCILQTIAGTGMRIGELKYLTAETLEERKIRIDFKGKVRIILIPRSLLIILKDYCRKHKIKEVFSAQGTEDNFRKHKSIQISCKNDAYSFKTSRS